MNPPARTTLFFENNAGQLFLEPAGYVRARWSNRPRTISDSRNFFTHMMQALQTNGWSRLLTNQTDMPSFSPAEQEWLTNEWLPRAVREGGYRYGAVVVSTSVLARLATAYITTNVQGLPLVYRSFETEAEAEQWLLQQPASPRQA